MGSCVSSKNFYQCGESRQQSQTSDEDELPNLSINSLEHNSNSNNNNNNNNNNITILHQINTSNNPPNNSDLGVDLDPMNLNSILIATSYFTNNSINTQGAQFVPPTGKNKKLKKDSIKNFKFDRAITEKQLNAKRDEFWHTAPHFEGKIEIWTALRAAVEACEVKNYGLAQVIVDSANIILPRGVLSDCYDELGNRYQVPVYVLTRPVNMRKSNLNGTSSEEKESEGSLSIRRASKKSKEDDFDEDDLDDFNLDELNIQKTKSSFLKGKLKLSKVPKTAGNLLGSTSFSFDSTNKKQLQKQSESTETTPGSTLQQQRSNSVDELFQIKLRVSNLNYNDQDLKLKVASNQTVRQLKNQLCDMIQVEAVRQRMFFGGKLMKDKQRLCDHKLRRNVVVQVIVRELKKEENDSNEVVVQFDDSIIVNAAQKE